MTTEYLGTAAVAERLGLAVPTIRSYIRNSCPLQTSSSRRRQARCGAGLPRQSMNGSTIAPGEAPAPTSKSSTQHSHSNLRYTSRAMYS